MERNIYQIKNPSDIGKAEKDLKAAGFPVWQFAHNNLIFAFTDNADVSPAIKKLAEEIGGIVIDRPNTNIKIPDKLEPVTTAEFMAKLRAKPEQPPVEPVAVAAEPLKTDPVAALDYLRKLLANVDGELLLNVAAIGDKGIKPEAYKISELMTDGKAFQRFVADHQSAGRNIYYQPNPLKRQPKHGKATKADTAEPVHFVFRDIDPDKTANEAERSNWQRRTIAERGNEATALINSGNGIQQIFTLTEPVTIAHAEEINGDLCAAVSADKAATDVCRLLRMPGTINFPGESKRKKGRVQQQASLIGYTDGKLPTPPYHGTREAATVDGTGPDKLLLGLEPDTIHVCKTGKRPASELREASEDFDAVEQYEGASEARWRVIGDMLRGGLVKKEMIAILLNFPAIKGDKPNRDKKWAETEIRRFVNKTAPPHVKKLNSKYFFSVVGGKPTVCYRGYSALHKTDILRFMSTETFRAKHPLPKIGRTGAGADWLTSPYRRQFNDVALMPGQPPVVGDTYNLWQGFDVEAKAGDCSKLKAHMLDILCCGNAEHYEYLMNWLARMFQKPDSRGEVAVVMKGGKGVGKGLVAQYVGDILRSHYAHISNSKQLTGNFNDHMREIIFLFSDEATWGGDKQAEGRLKALITEWDLTIEKKYHDSEPVPNYLHIMMAANEEWCVPVSEKERRYFILEPSDKRRGDRPYFDAILDEQKNGGPAALLHELQNRDLSGWNVRNVPVTYGLQNQAALNMDTVTAFWHEFIGHDFAQTAVKPEFYGRYLAFAERIGDRRPKDMSLFSKAVRKLHPDGKIPSRQTTVFEPGGDKKRSREYVFADLDKCRDYFVRDFMGWDEYVWDESE